MTVVGAATLVVMAAGSGTAFADCYNVGTAAGSNTETVGPSGSGSRASQSWTKSTKHFSLTARGISMASNKCLTSWFDWSTQSGHLDSRAVRNCNLSVSEYNAAGTDSVGGRTPNTGMQKSMGCYGTNNSSTQTCVTGSLSVSSCTFQASHSFSNANKVTRAWVLNANGTPNYYSGGDPADAAS